MIVILDFKVIVEILGHLDDPRDLVRAGQVCKIMAILSRMATRMLMRMMRMVTKRAYSENMTKIAIYCPQGSGTLRQQLLMIH